MTVFEAIDLFQNEVNNEIFHSAASEQTKDELIDAVKGAKQIVIDTYHAEQKRK